MARSQAALEFLTTYAWAFLAIMVTMGALYYFGVFNFSKFLPQECIFQQQFECTASSFIGGATDEVRFRLVNNIGETVYVKAYQIDNDLPQPLTCTTNPAEILDWTAGEQRDFVFSGCSDGGFIDNERAEAEITITYCADETNGCCIPGEVGCVPDPSVDHIITGKIRAVVTKP